METDGTSETCDGTKSVKRLKHTWEKWSNDQDVTLPHLKKGWEKYGRPLEGSKTELRGKEAHSHVHNEVKELCQIISAIGHRRGDETTEVEFGTLFEHYIPISNKLVGVLLRARKQGLVYFLGEMLWQGRDDRVLIKLLS